VQGVAPSSLGDASLTGFGGTASPPPPPVSPPPASGGQTLQAQDGGSTLVGGSGNDTLIGAHGPDQMTGAGGADHFVFKVAPWSPGEITDFTHGQDLLDLRGMFGGTGYTGADPVADHYLTLLADGSGGTKVLFDADGPGPGQGSYVIHLAHVDPASLTAADWLVH
jgi:Ca2+-binding RTX toxin-like protein